jgi:hypothetical protein
MLRHCELCYENVSPEEYDAHVLNCSQLYMNVTPLLSAFFPLLSDGFNELQSMAYGNLTNQGRTRNVVFSMTFVRQDEEDFGDLEPVYVGVDDVESVTTLSTDRNITCPICQDEPSEGELIRKINKCSHAFCSKCIIPWLKMSKKCPMCMTHLDK